MFIPPFTIGDVSDLLSIERLRNDSVSDCDFPVVCPFCGDRRGKMNFCICKDGEIKNTYRCFYCGAQGNMLQLYCELQGLHGADACKTAFHEIRRKLAGKERISIVPRTAKKKMEIRKMAAASASPADTDQRERVYREMLTMLRLKERHRKHLLSRGLDREQVSRMEEMGFKSTDSEAAASICRRLIKSGHSLEGVPGFYLNRDKEWRIAFFDYNEGFLCPVWTRERKLIGFQIRPDRPFKDRKYTWLTSNGKERGCSSKSPAGYFGKPDVGIVYVTEGILKAAAAHLATGKPFIGNPGVAHYKEVAEILKEMKEDGLRLVMECYDMDKLLNLSCEEDYDGNCANCAENVARGEECPKKRRKRDDVRRGCNHLYRICEEVGLQCQRITWDTGKDGLWNGTYKGVDDWQLAEKEVRRKAA